MGNFKAGDLVRLKSGGPTMTVKIVEDPDVDALTSLRNHGQQYYWCQWFAGSRLNQGQFPDNALESADAEAPTKQRK
jgi:uncharacterized protein YodC (DUF2158 family)